MRNKKPWPVQHQGSTRACGEARHEPGRRWVRREVHLGGLASVENLSHASHVLSFSLFLRGVIGVFCAGNSNFVRTVGSTLFVRPTATTPKFSARHGNSMFFAISDAHLRGFLLCCATRNLLPPKPSDVRPIGSRVQTEHAHVGFLPALPLLHSVAAIASVCLDVDVPKFVGPDVIEPRHAVAVFAAPTLRELAAGIPYGKPLIWSCPQHRCERCRS